MYVLVATSQAENVEVFRLASAISIKADVCRRGGKTFQNMLSTGSDG